MYPGYLPFILHGIDKLGTTSEKPECSLKQYLADQMQAKRLRPEL